MYEFILIDNVTKENSNTKIVNENNKKVIEKQTESINVMFDELKDLLDEYKNLHNEVIPGLSAGWWAMEEEIGNCISQAHKLELALKNIDSEIKLNGLDAALTRIHSSIKSIDREIDRAFGSQKQELLNKYYQNTPSLHLRHVLCHNIYLVVVNQNYHVYLPDIR